MPNKTSSLRGQMQSTILNVDMGTVISIFMCDRHTEYIIYFLVASEIVAWMCVSSQIGYYIC